MFKIIQNYIKIKKDKLITISILSAILILTSIVSIIHLKDKSQYHFDEIYTYKTIALFPSPLIERYFDKWLSNNNINQDIFIINENQKHKYGRVAEVTKFDVHPPLYYWSMHFLGSIFESRFQGKYIAGFLNIVCYLAGSYLFYAIAKRVYENKYVSLAALFCYSISIATISNIIWARMYSMAIFSSLLFTYSLIRIISDKKYSFRRWFLYIFSFIIGALTHYYFLIYAFIILFVSAIILFAKALKRYNRSKLKIGINKIFKILFATIAGWLVALLIFPQAIIHLTQSGRSNQITDRLSINTSEKLGIFSDKISTILLKFNNYVFYKFYFFIIFILIILFLYFIFKHEKNNNINYRLLILLLSSSVIFSLIVTYISPYEDLRYHAFSIPFIFISIFSIFTFINNKYLKHLFLLVMCILFTINVINKKPIHIPSCYKVQETIYDNPKSVMIIDKKEISSLMYYFYMPKNINIFYSNGSSDSYKNNNNPENFYLILNTKNNKKILSYFQNNYKIDKQKARFCTIKNIYILDKK